VAVTTDTPLARALERVGDRWMLLIVDALLSGPRRFNELAEDVGGSTEASPSNRIAPNILSDRLRRLAAEAIVVARPYSRRPLRYTYELSANGRELAGVLRLLAGWAAGATEDTEPLRHGDCGTPMEARWYCPTCARTVADDEADLRFI
jgi:DNA-binding HxlR family transcriptional regulator